MKRILVVEGHTPTREHIERRLSAEGFAVSALEPAAPWEALPALGPDAVVLAGDLGARGRELAARMRKLDPGLPLLVTDKAHLGRALGRERALDPGASAYVADPSGPELLERLREALAERPPRLGTKTRRILERRPAEEGEVRPGGIASALLRLWRGGADGILEIRGPRATRRLFLLRGGPVAFESDARADRLGPWLVASGNLSESQYRSARDVLASGDLSESAALVAAGALEPGQPLSAALRAHLCAMVSLLAGERHGRFAFHPGSEFEGEVAAVLAPALAPVLDGVRAALPARHFAVDLRAALEAYPTRTADFPRLVPEMALGSADLRLALGLDGRSTTRALLESRRAELGDALPLLWFLERVGAIAFQPRAVEGPLLPSPETARPPERRPLPEVRAEELRQIALRVLPGSYFRALGVDIAADTEEVERAYHEAAARLHPGGYAEFDVGPLEDLLLQVQDKLHAAYRVLSNEERRRTYLGFLLSRVAAETGRRHADVLPEAEVALKRGERALRLRRAGEAVRELRQATELGPREPEYAALLAFATLVDPSSPVAERVGAAARHARRALALDPACVRAQVVLSLVETASGNPAEARRHAEAAARAAPGSALARRALERLGGAPAPES